jgi:hypothetical protein
MLCDEDFSGRALRDVRDRHLMDCESACVLLGETTPGTAAALCGSVASRDERGSIYGHTETTAVLAMLQAR